jgi:hypothetical protein
MTQLTQDEHTALSRILREEITVPPDLYTKMKEERERKMGAHEMKPVDEPESLVGQIVFIENTRNDEKGRLSTYENGEYFVTRETPTSIYAIPIGKGVGYDLSNDRAWVKRDSLVVESWEEDGHIRMLADELAYWAAGPSRGEKRSWTQNVYDRAARNAERMHRILDDKLEADTPKVSKIADILPLDNDLTCPSCGTELDLNVEIGLTQA